MCCADSGSAVSGVVQGDSSCPPAGLLTSGLIPAVRHALHNLLTHDAIVIPSSATVFVQASCCSACDRLMMTEVSS